jgi:hypothetical protein
MLREFDVKPGMLLNMHSIWHVMKEDDVFGRYHGTDLIGIMNDLENLGFIKYCKVSNRFNECYYEILM